MLYRAAMIGIIAFWLVMMGLLVRLETHPEATNIMDVPVSYVIRLIFKQHQQSILTVSNETKAIGTIFLRPLITGSDTHTLNFSGALPLQLPMLGAQRFNFSGAVDMSETLRVRDFRVDITTRPQVYHLGVQGDAARNTLAYEWSRGDQHATPQTLPVDAAALFRALAQTLGVDLRDLPIDPAVITAPAIAAPAITARETQIALRGELLEVYEVTVNEGAAPMLDFYVTELGQIVVVKTNFGYSLAAEDWQ
jgi:hypothetical protein